MCDQATKKNENEKGREKIIRKMSALSSTPCTEIYTYNNTMRERLHVGAMV